MEEVTVQEVEENVGAICDRPRANTVRPYESEEERREAEKGSKSDAEEKVSDSRPHSSSVSSADSFPPGEATAPPAGTDSHGLRPRNDRYREVRRVQPPG